jgi:hypothetical protein
MPLAIIFAGFTAFSLTFAGSSATVTALVGAALTGLEARGAQHSVGIGDCDVLLGGQIHNGRGSREIGFRVIFQ